MKAGDRLDELKAEAEDGVTSERFVFLLNPKNVQLMEAMVAWTSCGVSFDSGADVPDGASMDGLWKLCHVDMQTLADTAGITVNSAIMRLRQLRNLGLIFPDGTAVSKGIGLVKVYVSRKVEGMGK